MAAFPSEDATLRQPKQQTLKEASGEKNGDVLVNTNRLVSFVFGEI